MFKIVLCDNRTKKDIGLYNLVCPASEEIFEEQKHATFSAKIIVALAMTHIRTDNECDSVTFHRGVCTKPKTELMIMYVPVVRIDFVCISTCFWLHFETVLMTLH